MFPVLVLVLVVLTAVQAQLASANKTATTVPNSGSAIVSPSSPGMSYSRNQSIPDTSSTKIQENAIRKLQPRCKNCGVKSPPVKGSLEYKIRIEMIKQQILNKLNMDEEPKISRPRFGIPRPLVKKFQERPIKEESKEPSAKSKIEVIVIGKQVPLPKSPRRPLKSRKAAKFVFNVSNKVHKHAVRSATLWLYLSLLKKSRKIILTVKDISDRDSPKVITKTIEIEDQGWVSFDVKQIVELWKSRVLKKRMLNISASCVLEISCSKCNHKDKEFLSSRSLHRPFILVDLIEGKSRKKRAIDCRPGLHDCCRQEFDVSFKEMGWDNWIMLPKNFRANYCTGSCYGHILPMYHHTGILQKLALQQRQRQIAPCCSPTKLTGLSLIYFDKDRNIFHSEIKNMIVQECGCS